MSIKTVAKDWLPPAVVRALRPLRSRGGIRFEGNYATWEAATAQCTGYDAEPILKKVLEATLKVKRGEAACERDSVLFDEIEYAWPVTAALMWAAAQNAGRLDVLDFGGALGSSYFQNRAFLANLPQVRWSVIEQAHYVQAGREHIQDDTLRFYSSIDSSTAEGRPNVILLSSVLQYIENPNKLIETLFKLNANTLIVDRTPFISGSANTVTIQHVPISIFPATLPAWMLSESILLKLADNLNYHRVAEFVNESSNFGSFQLKGFIFQRNGYELSAV